MGGAAPRKDPKGHWQVTLQSLFPRRALAKWAQLVVQIPGYVGLHSGKWAYIVPANGRSLANTIAKILFR